MNTYNIRNTWTVEEKGFDFDLHYFYFEGQNDPNYRGRIYPYDLKQQDQLRKELLDGSIDLSEWPIEWEPDFRPEYH